MELLVGEIDERLLQRFLDRDGAFTHCCEWPLVLCDRDSVVFEVMWYGFFTGGSICLEYMPNSVLNFTANNLSGTVDLTRLSSALEELDLSAASGQGYRFTGSVDLTSLPETLEGLKLARNKFSGSVDLTRLPAALLELNLAGNALSGQIELRNIPTLTHTIKLNENFFSGIAIIEHFPGLFVDLRGNRLEAVQDTEGKEIEISEYVPFRPVDGVFRVCT